MHEVDEHIDQVIEFYQSRDIQFFLDSFLLQIKNFFEKNPRLHIASFPTIHSVKGRLKDPDHLREKIIRKEKEKGIRITTDNLFENITDLIGVRVLHLYQEQFKKIHMEIENEIATGDWSLVETPKAYTWDPETELFYQSLGIKTEVRDSYYTSVHYLIKLNNRSTACCEIQVRTLFEEIWGEIDHAINYPQETKSIACKEQLRVLSKLVSTGTRLSDSIFRSYNEFLGTHGGSHFDT